MVSSLILLLGGLIMLEKLGKKEWEFNIEIGKSKVKVPFQIVLLAVGGVLCLGFLKAARQL
jgi:hypothetical protein